MQAYLQVKDVKGSVTEKGHEGWMRIDSFNFGVSNPSSGDPSKEGKLVAGGAQYNDISIIKDLDVTSPQLASICSQGKHVGEVKIDVCEDATSVNPLMTLTLTDTIISSYNVGPGGAKPSECLTFAYAKIKMECTALDQKGSKKASADYTWDLLTKKLA